MKENRLTITINKPVSFLFRYTLDPKNTSKWIDFIVIEETNEWPARLGTVYKNQNRQGEWKEYLLTEFEEDEHFVLTQKGGPYRVRYTFRFLDEDSTEFEYYEWVEQGGLDELFTDEPLQKLKQLVESQ